jgi:hypothetical protein
VLVHYTPQNSNNHEGICLSSTFVFSLIVDNVEHLWLNTWRTGGYVLDYGAFLVHASMEHLCCTSILPPSLNKLIPRICATNFIEKSNNIYDIKLAPYENILYGKSNDTNLVP